jgi:hypothetical protein
MRKKNETKEAFINGTCFDDDFQHVYDYADNLGG